MERNMETNGKETTMSKHTPGPWSREPELYDKSKKKFVPRPVRGSSFLDGFGIQIWSQGIGHTGIGLVHEEADARLIAAAPELLEAVKAFMERGGTGSMYDTDQVTGDTFYAAMRYAVDKAEGRTE